jgi:hypothetical protein
MMIRERQVMKLYKVVFFAVLTSFLPLSMVSSWADNPIPKAPYSQNLVVAPTTIAPGGSVNVSFEVISSSPLQSDASIITFSGPGGVTYSKIYMRSSGTNLDGLWNANITIPATAPAGTYDLAYSIPFDANGLSGGFAQAPKALTVTGASSAPTKQVIKNVLVSPNEVQPGGITKVSFEIVASSPMQSDASIVTFTGPGGVTYSKIYMRSGGTTTDGIWTADVTIPDAAPSGYYDLTFSVPFDANGLSTGFQRVATALKVGNVPSAQPSPSPTPTPTAEPTSSPQTMPTQAPKVVQKQKVTSINCSKGKLVKKVTGANPTCPIGYKLKR